MAKSKKKPIVEKLITTRKIDITGFLNLDKLQGLIMEIEDTGDVDVGRRLKKYNGEFGTLSFTVKNEEEVQQEIEE